MPTQNINVGGGLVPEVTLFGDWDKLSRALKELPATVMLGAMEGKNSAAEKIVAIVKKNIRQGGPTGYRWDAYSPKYQKRKSSRGGNVSRKWYFTGTYYNNIKVINKGLSTFAGVPRGVRGKVNPTQPLTLGQIANILERGSVAKNIKARPLWRPSFKEFGGQRRVHSHIVWHIRSVIFIRTGLKAKLTL